MENGLMDMGRGEERVRCMERITWKQPRCPSTDEWIKKLWYIYTMEYYSSIKKECTSVSSNEVDKPGTYYTPPKAAMVIRKPSRLLHTICPGPPLKTYTTFAQYMSFFSHWGFLFFLNVTILCALSRDFCTTELARLGQQRGQVCMWSSSPLPQATCFWGQGSPG